MPAAVRTRAPSYCACPQRRTVWWHTLRGAGAAHFGNPPPTARASKRCVHSERSAEPGNMDSTARAAADNQQAAGSGERAVRPEQEAPTEEGHSWLGYLGSAVWTVGFVVPWYIAKTGMTVSTRVASRVMNPPETPEQSMEKENTFHRKLQELEEEDFSDLEGMNLVELSGVDKRGRSILWITGRHLPAMGQDLMRIKWFIYKKVHEVAQAGEFVIVYLNAEVVSEENSPGVWWIRRSYEEVPQKYKDLLRRFFVVHPGGYLRSLLWLLGPVATGGFWDKLEYVDRVEFLWDEIDRSQCRFPDFVLAHDAELETQPLMDYGIYNDPTQAANGDLGAYMAAGHVNHTTSHYRNQSVRGH